jgi:hypothetical protein
VSGNCQKSYTTYAEALSVYAHLKESRLVRVVRKPGDEALFGPDEEAME